MCMQICKCVFSVSFINFHDFSIKIIEYPYAFQHFQIRILSRKVLREVTRMYKKILRLVNIKLLDLSVMQKQGAGRA